jgi:hypothetical protein
MKIVAVLKIIARGLRLMDRLYKLYQADEKARRDER